MTHPANVPDPEAVIVAGWPLHGPYAAGHTATAAQAVAALVRYLAYATRGPARLPDPAAVHDVLAALTAAAAGLPQALRQTAQRLSVLGNSPYASVDTLGEALTPPQAARIAVEDLYTAARHFDRAAQRLDAAQNLAGRLSLAADGGRSRIEVI